MRFVFTIFIGLVFSTNVFSKNHNWKFVNSSYGAIIHHSSKIIKRNNQRQTYVVIDYLKPINKIYNSALYKIHIDCKTNKIKFSEKVLYTSRRANKKMANGKLAKKQPAKLDKKDFGKWYTFPGVNWWSLTANQVCNFDKIEAKKKQQLKKYNLNSKNNSSKKIYKNNKSTSNTSKFSKKTNSSKVNKKKNNSVKNNALAKKRIRELKRILSKEEFRKLETLFGTKFIEEIALLDEKNWRAFINQIKKTTKTTQQIKKQSQKKQPQKKEFKKEFKKQQINKQKIEKKSFKKEDEKKKEFKIEVEKKNTYKK